MTILARCHLPIVGAIAAIILAWWSMSRSSSSPSLIFDHNLPKFNATGQSQVCINLATTLPDWVFSQQHPVFQETLDYSYASQAREEVPECIVKPGSAQDVSRALNILKVAYDANHEVRFAIRSGGHHPGPGHSSIEGGVLIDLRRINEVTVSQDRQNVVIGTGARWGYVYARLDSMGLTVAGGRNADVGVGGLALGGGISFFSPQVGMVCDNILEYEIVLANGTILVASELENADLWKSLKGGSGNFGIVTRFTARAFPTTKIWAGFNYYTFSKATKLVQALYEFSKPEAFDEHVASPMFSLNYINSPALKVACVNTIHTKPEKWPKSLSAFKTIWPRWSTAKIRSVADAAEELSKSAPRGRRQHYVTLTIKNDYETLQAIPAAFEESIASIQSVKGITWTIVLQPLPTTITHKGSPNVLGLESRNVSDPTPILVLICPVWRLVKDDMVVIRTAQELHDKLFRLSRERGSGDDYIYMNYASDYQDPFKGYGEGNRVFLRDTSLKYDPNRFFQRASSGVFKLDR